MPRFQWRVLYQDLDNLGLQVWTFTCTLLVTFLYYCGISKDSLRVPLSIRERISKPHPGAGAAPPTARHTHSALATHRSARPLLPHVTLTQHWPHTEVRVLRATHGPSYRTSRSLSTGLTQKCASCGPGAAPPTTRHTHSALASHRSMRPVGQARPLLPHFTLAQHWPHTEVCVLAQLQNCSKTTATVPCDSRALGCS